MFPGIRLSVPLVVALIVALGHLLPATSAGADQREVIVHPLVVLSGADSHVREASYRRVTSNEAWKQVWLEHLGLKDDTIYRQMFDVDFDRCMVVVLFRGSMTNIASLRIVNVTETDKTIVMQFGDVGYQTGVVGPGPDPGEQATPYAFVVLPKSEKPIVLEEDVHQYKGQPPVWKELTRLWDHAKN